MDCDAKERAERPVSFRVIVPAWQVAGYLGEALESVRAQPFGQWVCHVVDDGSVDRTGTIADAFCRKDERFRVTHQRNAGVSAARNRALPVHGAESEYLVFLDADDTLAPDCFAWMSKVIHQDHPDYLEWRGGGKKAAPYGACGVRALRAHEDALRIPVEWHIQDPSGRRRPLSAGAEHVRRYALVGASGTAHRHEHTCAAKGIQLQEAPRAGDVAAYAAELRLSVGSLWKGVPRVSCRFSNG